MALRTNGAARAAIERFGRIDVLCNLAGGFRMGEAAHETADRNWDFLFDINARTLLHAVRAVCHVVSSIMWPAMNSALSTLLNRASAKHGLAGAIYESPHGSVNSSSPLLSSDLCTEKGLVAKSCGCNWAVPEHWKHADEQSQPQVRLVAKACAKLDDADLVAQAFDATVRDLVLWFAIGSDAIPMPLDDLGELQVRLESLPAQAATPVVEEAPGPAFAPVATALSVQLLELVGSRNRQELERLLSLGSTGCKGSAAGIRREPASDRLGTGSWQSVPPARVHSPNGRKAAKLALALQHKESAGPVPALVA